MLTIKFRTDNAAFEDMGAECSYILRKIAARIEDGDTTGNVVDTNGNVVGTFTLTGR